MKVIIELNESLTLRNVIHDDEKVEILIRRGQTIETSIVKIEDLKIALRKMTAK